MQQAILTQKNYATMQLAGYGFTRFCDIPEEMLDYLPENLERDEDDGRRQLRQNKKTSLLNPTVGGFLFPSLNIHKGATMYTCWITDALTGRTLQEPQKGNNIRRFGNVGKQKFANDPAFSYEIEDENGEIHLTIKTKGVHHGKNRNTNQDRKPSKHQEQQFPVPESHQCPSFPVQTVVSWQHQGTCPGCHQ